MTATKSLRGAVGSIALTDVLLTLQNTGATGLLRVQRDGVARDLWVSGGTLVAAESSAGTDALEWLLLTAGAISQDRCDRVRERIDAGQRRGAALVETAGLTPSQLFQWTERRARFLACDVIGWKSGDFTFEEGALPPDGAIPVSLAPRDVLLGALRDPAAAPLLADRAPAPEATPVPASRAGDEALLAPEERYVLALVDGRRTIADIVALSEIGERETLLIVARLALTGFVSPHVAERPEGFASRDQDAAGGADGKAAAADGKAATADGKAATADGKAATADGKAATASGEPGSQVGEWIALPAGDSHNALRGIIVASNRMFVAAGACMVRDIGPIAEHLLEKALRDARARHPALFHRVTASRDGSLPEETMIRNLGMIKEGNPRRVLLSGLDAYLASIRNVVRRFLGTEHEASLVRLVKEELR